MIKKKEIDGLLVISIIGGENEENSFVIIYVNNWG